MLGEIMHGGEDAAFTSFRAGTSYLNLIAQPAERAVLRGRVIFYHLTLTPSMRGGLGRLSPRYGAPRCRMGRAFFHLTDPDGHELSFAWPLR
jgi:hypothetical protein